MPADEEVVSTAAAAAEERIEASYRRSDVRDLDVTVTFSAGELTVDVYLNAGAESEEEAQRERVVAEAAATAARDAVDRLFDATPEATDER